MILLDTNVVSEPWKLVPAPQVLAWLDAQEIDTLHLSAVTVAELRFGIAVMTPGRRRDTFHRRLEQQVLPLFDGRVLGFDLAAARAYADLMAGARAAGKAVGKADGYIAATAAVHGLIVATRDTSPFENVGLETIDPWRT